jgi:hypothetical protein
MEQRVGTVHDAYEAWNTIGPEGLRPWVTDDLELHDPPQMPDARAWLGLDAVLARLEEVAASIGGRWVELREMRPVGDEILVAMTWRVDSSSDSAVLGEVFHLVALTDGRISRIRVFLAEQDALAATAG